MHLSNFELVVILTFCDDQDFAYVFMNHCEDSTFEEWCNRQIPTHAMFSTEKNLIILCRNRDIGLQTGYYKKCHWYF